MRTRIVSAVAAAAATVAMGGGLAAASAHPATTRTESFQMMTTSATGPTASVIASGLFTAGGVDHENPRNGTATFAFAHGSVKLRHSAGHGRQSVNPKTCLVTISVHGTYTIVRGTGSYAGITGHGHYRLSILSIAARTGGTCSQSKPPVAFHQVIDASGPVTRP